MSTVYLCQSWLRGLGHEKLNSRPDSGETRILFKAALRKISRVKQQSGSMDRKSNRAEVQGWIHINRSGNLQQHLNRDTNTGQAQTQGLGWQRETEENKRVIPIRNVKKAKIYSKNTTASQHTSKQTLQ